MSPISKVCHQHPKIITNIKSTTSTNSDIFELSWCHFLRFLYLAWKIAWHFNSLLESSNYSPTFFMTRDTCSAMTSFSWLGLSKKFPENYIFIIFFECIISNNFILRLYHVFKIWIFIIFIISWRFHRVINVHHLKL